jgi:hypothetical protein
LQPGPQPSTITARSVYRVPISCANHRQHDEYCAGSRCSQRLASGACACVVSVKHKDCKQVTMASPSRAGERGLLSQLLSAAAVVPYSGLLDLGHYTSCSGVASTQAHLAVEPAAVCESAVSQCCCLHAASVTDKLVTDEGAHSLPLHRDKPITKKTLCQ